LGAQANTKHGTPSITMTTPQPHQTPEQIGALTRTLHHALHELGVHHVLTEVTHEIPDARDRLVYVGKLTEEAAHKVLSTIDQGQPECSAMADRGREIAETLRQRADAELSPVMCKAMMKQCADYAERAALFAEAQNALLTEIMMAQSFQDLSGQVIKKVVDIITRTETQLLTVLKDSDREHPELAQAEAEMHKLEGPQVPDKALQQDDVDALLASMDF